MKSTVRSQPLNTAQLMVLQVVKGQYNEQDLDDLRRLLLDFNDRKTQLNLDRTITQKHYTSSDFEKILHGHHPDAE
jgi:hypothetical protein